MPHEFLKKLDVNSEHVKLLTSIKGKSEGLRTIVDICRASKDKIAGVIDD
jgi:hypothetical protein